MFKFCSRPAAKESIFIGVVCEYLVAFSFKFVIKFSTSLYEECLLVSAQN